MGVSWGFSTCALEKGEDGPGREEATNREVETERERLGLLLALALSTLCRCFHRLPAKHQARRRTVSVKGLGNGARGENEEG